jgi:hypothetical protein
VSPDEAIRHSGGIGSCGPLERLVDNAGQKDSGSLEQVYVIKSSAPSDHLADRSLKISDSVRMPSTVLANHCYNILLDVMLAVALSSMF